LFGSKRGRGSTLPLLNCFAGGEERWSATVSSLCLLYGAWFWRIYPSVKRTGSFRILGPHWGPLILEFVVAALAGFFVALPENTDLRGFSWRELLIGGIPVLVLALAPIMY
jgi:hypothetical protein